MRRRDRKLAVLALVAAAAVPIGWASAQTAPAKAAAKPAAGAKLGEAADPKQAKAAAIAAAQKAYEAGTKAFESGKHKDAVAQLSTALAGGGLPSPQMAKALYYRGVANRKLAKPAQAMSDLTTAIWVSGGLSDADRAAAIENRQAAYREAGLGDQAPADINPDPVASTANAALPVAVAALAQPAPAASPAAVAAAPAPAAEATAVAAAEAQATAPTAPAPKAAQPDNAGIPNPFGEPAATSPAPKAAPSLSAVPAEPAPAAADPGGPTVLEKAGNSIAEAGNNVGSFFGNMFKSSSSTPAPAPAQTAAPTALAPQAGPEPQTSASPVLTAANPDGAPTGADWGNSTQIKAAKGTKIAAVAPTPQPAANPVSTGAIAPAAAAPALAAPKALTGKYQLQIAAVRSRAEAEALAQKVKQQHAAALGGREPIVDEAVIGNFGNFHRVRVGPYADAKEPGKFCSTLIKTGFDCLVVTQ